jgi:eukaryotic-like serine/threonine-protein kinase
VPADHVLHPGEEFEGYVVDEVVGHGGCANVYRAHDAAQAGAVVALKVLAGAQHRPAEYYRLRREFDFAHRLGHAHIVSVQRSGPGWLTMAYVDGGTVTSAHSLELRLNALAQIADALDYVHRCGIIHCDVKPSNILVHLDFSAGGAVLIDFGVAYELAEDPRKRPQQLQASLPYTAPEVLRGQIPQATTDVYGLACTAVELITGAPPFEATTPLGLVEDQLYSAPPRVAQRVSWAPRALDSVLGRAMAKDPEIRYESCTEFVAALRRVLQPHRANR